MSLRGSWGELERIRVFFRAGRLSVSGEAGDEMLGDVTPGIRPILNSLPLQHSSVTHVVDSLSFYTKKLADLVVQEFLVRRAAAGAGGVSP
jgi:hypothetical protein